MKPYLTIIVTLFLSTNFFAQKNLDDFVPKGYYMLGSTQGDLNNDNLADAVLVFGKNGEDSLSTIEHPLHRKLLVLFAQPNKTYQVAAQSTNQVYYYNYDPNFKDAFVSIRIEKGIFYVEHYGGFAQRWGRTTAFQYNAADKLFYLVSDENSTFDATDYNNTLSEKTYTQKNFGKVPLNKFNIYKIVK